MKPEKLHNGGQWTTARKNSFIMSALRGASRRWNPMHAARKDARTARNTYTCAACKKSFGSKQIRVDHIQPVREVTGKDNSWDAVIRRMFCEKDGYQVLCIACAQLKNNMENAARKFNKEKHK
jgi:5-methylcytosine-specific restriction endonuclease McrA